MTGTMAPLITVVVPTVNECAAIAGTIESILRNDYPNFELHIVGQSDSAGTRRYLSPYLTGPRVRYIRAPRVGVATNRNVGVQHASGELVAFTDDDCTVPGDWLTRFAEAFRLDARIAMVFGNVLAGPHNRKLGFVQAYVRTHAFLARDIGDKHRVEGIGACMAVRRRVWGELGGFDPSLGAGSRFRSAEETDFAVRALLAGCWVFETPAVSVVHHGLRTWKDRPKIVRNYLYGLGAMSGKHLSAGHWGVLLPMVHLARRWAFQAPVVDLGGRPPRGLRLWAYLRGLAAGALFKPACPKPMTSATPASKSPTWQTPSNPRSKRSANRP